MEWDNDKCLHLINLYRLKPEIWDPMHKFHQIKNRKNDAWCDIANEVGTTVDVIKGKINSLIASFRRERAKYETSIEKGKDTVYKSNWFAYEAFQFLMDNNRRLKTIYTTQKKKHSQQDEATEEDDNLTDALTNDDNDSDSCDECSFILPLPKKRKLENKTESKQDKIVNTTKRDTCEIYGELVTIKLQSYSKRAQSVVQHLVNNILFKADMGHYEGSPSNIDDPSLFDNMNPTSILCHSE